MIFFVIIPTLAGEFGNFLIPLMIGAKDMAFPKLNMMSYWFMWPAFLVILSSFFVQGGGSASGWTSYPTLASVTMPAGTDFEDAAKKDNGLVEKIKAAILKDSPAQPAGRSQVMWLIALIFVGVSSMMGSVNYITTIINMRAAGMTLFRSPITVWAMFIPAILQAIALPVLSVSLFLQLLDKT